MAAVEAVRASTLAGLGHLDVIPLATFHRRCLIHSMHLPWHTETIRHSYMSSVTHTHAWRTPLRGHEVAAAAL